MRDGRETDTIIRIFRMRNRKGVERSDGQKYFSPEIIQRTKVRTESLRNIYSYINEKELRTSQSENYERANQNETR